MYMYEVYRRNYRQLLIIIVITKQWLAEVLGEPVPTFLEKNQFFPEFFDSRPTKFLLTLFLFLVIYHNIFYKIGSLDATRLDVRGRRTLRIPLCTPLLLRCYINGVWSRTFTPRHFPRTFPPEKKCK